MQSALVACKSLGLFRILLVGSDNLPCWQEVFVSFLCSPSLPLCSHVHLHTDSETVQHFLFWLQMTLQIDE